MSHLIDARLTASCSAAIAMYAMLMGSASAAAGCDVEPNAAAAIRCLEAKLSSLQASLDRSAAEWTKIPRGAVVPFDSAECPSGWTDYLPAQGRFVRGIDKTGAKIDPDGRRAPGALQQDEFAEHRHDRPAAVYDAGGGANASWVASARHLGYGHTNPPPTGPAGRGDETRPKNVALLYCHKQ